MSNAVKTVALGGDALLDDVLLVGRRVLPQGSGDESDQTKNEIKNEFYGSRKPLRVDVYAGVKPQTKGRARGPFLIPK